MKGVAFLQYRFGPSIYGNTFDRAKNSLWRSYHKECQEHFNSNDAHMFMTTRKKVAELRRDSLCVLGAYSNDNLAKKVAKYFEDEDSVYAAVPQNIQVLWADLIFKSIEPFVHIIESFYKSYFQPYWLSVQQTKPGSTSAASSFGWHIDDNPKEMLKLFIYLNDVSEQNGAFRAFPKRTSKYLLLKGFRSGGEESRLRAQKSINTFLENKPRKLKVLEGQAGTVLAFDNNLVHKGTAPLNGFRHAIQIPIFPSKEKINVEMFRRGLLSTRNRDYPQDPNFNDYGN